MQAPSLPDLWQFYLSVNTGFVYWSLSICVICFKTIFKFIFMRKLQSL